MDSVLIVIVIACFIAAFVNAAFATGGIYIILLASISVLPVSHAIPLQSAFAAGSLIARIYFFRRHISWRIFNPFMMGGVLGVYLGAQAFITLPEDIITVSLGIVLLLLIWLPEIRWQLPVNRSFLFIGVLHSGLGTMFGVGGILQPIVFRTKLNRLEITGTLAACLLGLEFMKVVAYVGIGFDYRDYFAHIVGATIAGYLGTLLGKRVMHRVSEQSFRRVFRVLVSVVAIRLIIK